MLTVLVSDTFETPKIIKVVLFCCMYPVPTCMIVAVFYLSFFTVTWYALFGMMFCQKTFVNIRWLTLLVMSASAFLAFTQHGTGGHTHTFVCHVVHWLLQCCPGGCTESNYRRTAASVEHCGPCGQRYPQVRLRIVTTSPYWATLAGCSWVSHIQARHHGVQLPARSAPPYLVELCQPVAGVTSRQHLWSATRQLLVVPCHQLSSYGRWAFRMAGPSVWNSLPDNLQDPIIGGNIFWQCLKTFLFATYWCIYHIRGCTI